MPRSTATIWWRFLAAACSLRCLMTCAEASKGYRSCRQKISTANGAAAWKTTTKKPGTITTLQTASGTWEQMTECSESSGEDEIAQVPVSGSTTLLELADVLLSPLLADEIATLHRRQRQAVTHHGNLVVLAGPGAGKTRTLVARVGYLLAEISEHRGVAAITFTDAAAQ